MIIYLDLVIISTIAINTLIILGIESAFNNKCSLIRLVISNIFSVSLLALYIFPFFKISFIRYLLGLPLGIISFRNNGICNLIIKIVLYYILNLTFIGTLMVFEVKNFFVLILCGLLISVASQLLNYKNNYEITLKLDNKAVHALFDSGNCTYYLNKPVVFIKEKYLKDTYIKVGIIEVNTVNSKSMLEIYRGPKLMIKNKSYDVYYAFTSQINYDLILHKDIGGFKCLNC